MRIALLLVLVAACTDPVREGHASLTLDGADASRGTAVYRVIGGSSEGFCGHPHEYVPRQGADVEFGPVDADLVALTESEPGTYTATVDAPYASGYQFSIDGEHFTLASPPYFTATIAQMSPTRARVELSETTLSTDAMIQMPDGNTTSRTLVGSPATIDADFSKAGMYQIELVRSAENSYGVVEVKRTISMEVP